MNDTPAHVKERAAETRPEPMVEPTTESESKLELSPEGRKPGLYIVLISVHGLIRGSELELGRDADTGGQTLYVVELARALAKHPVVSRVDLITRLVRDDRVSADYAEPEEPLADAPNARIVRVPAGPDEYLPKEQLWDHLDSLSDHALDYIRQTGLKPALVHSHYADAGYVGMRLSLQLGVPLVHTGHSLGRVKRQRLLASGESAKVIEQKYALSRRIRVEEEVLAASSLVVVSTQDEIETQYGLYDWADPSRMEVIPPGVDLTRFDPKITGPMPIADELARFLREPDKPAILALSRPDERKNIATLIHAYGGNLALQDVANLVIVAGNRDDIRDMDPGSRQVLTEILLLIDRYDLYGKAAYPRHHQSQDVPDFYRWTAERRGVFINPALTEPFGLTLIEAAACGLPILATEDGGPRDIIRACKNGELINPLDAEGMGQQLLALLTDATRWDGYARNGIKGVRQHYTWPAHVEHYLEALASMPLYQQTSTPTGTAEAAANGSSTPMTADRMILIDDRILDTDIDVAALRELIALLRRHRRQVAYGLVSDRPRHEILALLKKQGLIVPDVLITRGGTQIHYGARLSRDKGWSRHIGYDWQGDRVYELLAETPGVRLSGRSHQGVYAIHGLIEKADAFTGLEDLADRLHQADIPARITVLNKNEFLVTPQRASKGFAIRYLADQHDIPLMHMLVVGSAEADNDLLGGNVLSAQLGTDTQSADNSIYYPSACGVAGIRAAMDFYDFLGECRVPTSDPDAGDANGEPKPTTEASGPASSKETEA
ncbi:MAG: sucrose-phosphate synthase [Halothiobacillus sp. 15-55-196]|jgi:sucrose-phosphate synthase|uniref:HAD family hydrolase n=1 Tax=Halothiobacillus sp. 15-55-196 TaxID=1970382 RepID=UPI000BD5BD94|nr:HAD family hydrolase [Halothiobacillus sp. 15-55-196]OZB36468.1 MAG: sucrose-phosphate synthase [Halothiobacillus sp. 15-55-196]OZB78533.1 MAG: sucrose-phosphate synthase [Halothiobacillus sp. 13-55-115]